MELAPLPTAEIAGRGALPRLGRWVVKRLEAPRFGVLGWSISGGFFANLGLMLWAMIREGEYAGLSLGVLLVVIAGCGAMVLMWPFLLSAAGYFVMVDRGVPDRRIVGALWGALAHAVGHGLLLDLMGAPWDAALAVPLLIGGLWGSWLPAVRAERLANLPPWARPRPRR